MCRRAQPNASQSFSSPIHSRHSQAPVRSCTFAAPAGQTLAPCLLTLPGWCWSIRRANVSTQSDLQATSNKQQCDAMQTRANATSQSDSVQLSAKVAQGSKHNNVARISFWIHTRSARARVFTPLCRSTDQTASSESRSLGAVCPMVGPVLLREWPDLQQGNATVVVLEGLCASRFPSAFLDLSIQAFTKSIFSDS